MKHFCVSYMAIITIVDILQIKQDGLRQDSIIAESDGHPKDIRKLECRHDCLRMVTITTGIQETFGGLKPQKITQSRRKLYTFDGFWPIFGGNEVP